MFFSVLSLLTIISFFYAFAKDEGTLGNDEFDLFMANLFNVFRFPFLTFLSFGGIVTFVFGLLSNIAIYSFILERLVSLFYKSSNV